MKKLIKDNIINIIYSFVILFVICVRFYSVLKIYDVSGDESIILSHMSSLLRNKTDAYGNRYPLFTQVGAGLATYTYLYPMAILARVFLGGYHQ